MRRALPIAVVLVLVAALGAALLRQQHRRAQAERALRLAVRGGDGGGLPLAPPSDEHLDAAALARIAQEPAAAGLSALLITRHGHLIYSRYGPGTGADTVIDSGGFARALIALATGIAVDHRLIRSPPLLFEPERLRDLIETSSHESYATFLGTHLWSRLNAGAAWVRLSAPGTPAPADCCFHARVQDWLRVGQLLANDGDFEDTDIVSRGWIQRMRQPQPSGTEGYGVVLPADRPGTPRYEARDLILLRGPGRWRLWIVPSLKLVVLFGAAGADDTPASAGSAAAGGWDETRLPNLVIDAVTDRSTVAPGSLLHQLVPDH